MRTPVMKHKPFWILAALTSAACSPEEQATRTDSVRGKALYEARCAQCHGATGAGAGPASAGLLRPAPSLRGLESGNDGIFPRDYVMTTIDGLSRHNQQVAAMPEFGAENLGPLIQIEEDGLSTPIPADLVALATYVETLQD